MNETAFRELISGEKRGVSATLLRSLLSFCSVYYRSAVGARNSLYNRGVLSARRAAVPVVSVGNITTGGTGKTPFVAHLCRWFRERDVHVVLLSRGYRALDAAYNDEKLVLDQLCPDVPHLQDADRVKSARIACDEHGAQVLVLDDGFQHRRLARNLDVVLIDAVAPWGYGYLLPRGLLREPVAALRRADLIVLTRADQVASQRKQQILDRIARIRGDSDVAEVAFVPQRLRNSEGQSAGLDSLAGQRVAAFCGIGNPAAFQATLEKAGFIVEQDDLQVFADHHHYTAVELASIGERAVESRCAAILTTQKDLVKINRADLNGCPLWAVEIGTDVLAGEELLERVLSKIAERIS